MNIAVYTSGGNVIVKYERINGVAFKMTVLRDNCAILPHLCDDLAQPRDNSAIFQNRTECLSPLALPISA